MPIAVYLSPRAEQQVSMLRARDRQTYDDFLINLRARGCEALHYRLTGNVLLERLCVVHLAQQLRVVVAFESAELATILLVAPHKDDDPFIDVYAQLYRLANIDVAPSGERKKPTCCEGKDGSAPVVDVEDLEVLVRRARELPGADKRRAQRASRR